MRDSLSRILVLTKRNVKEILRDPLSLIFMIGLPLALEVVFYFIFHDLTSQFEMKYLAPSIVVFSQSFLTLFTGLLIALDRSSAFLTRLYVSKAKSIEFIVGYALSLIPIAFVQSVLFFLVGGAIEPSLFSVNAILCILLSIVTSLPFIGLGILFGSVCNERSVGGVASIVIMGQSVLSGMWFPPEGLSGAVLTMMKVLPFKNAADLLKNVLQGITDLYADFLLPFIVVCAYAAAAFIAAVLLFRKKMKSK